MDLKIGMYLAHERLGPCIVTNIFDDDTIEVTVTTYRGLKFESLDKEPIFETPLDRFQRTDRYTLTRTSDDPRQWWYSHDGRRPSGWRDGNEDE